MGLTNHAAKLYFGIAAFGVAGAIGYQWVAGDRAGSLLLLGVAVAAVLAGLGVQGSVGRDWAPKVDADAAPDERPLDALDVGRPSPWPLVAALSLGGAAVGAAYDAAWLLTGLGIGLIPAVAWLVQVWREHPAWTPRLGERLSQRLIAPVVTPVGTFLIALFVAVSLSRTLLAVSQTASWVIAFIVAAALLAVLAAVAARPTFSRRAVVGLTSVGTVLAIVVGVVGGALGEREFHHAEPGLPSQQIEAVDIAFDADTLTLPAGTRSRVDFVNLDEEVWHNVSFYESKGGKPLFSGKPILGGEIEYTFVPPDNTGTYYFVCDFHENMEGDFVVVPAAEFSESHDEHGEHAESDDKHDKKDDGHGGKAESDEEHHE